MPHWLRTHWKQLLLLAFSLALSCILAELIYRAVAGARYRQHLARWDSRQWIVDPALPYLYRFPPGLAGNLGFQQDATKTFPFKINQDGFRGRSLGDQQNNTKRILVLGDSYAFGWGLDDPAEAFPARVESILNQDMPTTRALVFNCAVPGYNTEMEYQLLMDLLGRGLRFDVVVLTFVMNDAEPQFTVPIPPHQKYRWRRSWLFARAQEAANQTLLGGRAVFDADPYGWSFDYLEGFSPSSPKWRAARRAIESIADLCRRHKLPLLLFILPDFNTPLGADYPWQPIHQQVGNWGSESGIPTVDLLPAFRNGSPLEWSIEGDGHPNAAAHARIADLMAEPLAAALWPSARAAGE